MSFHSPEFFQLQLAPDTLSAAHKKSMSDFSNSVDFQALHMHYVSIYWLYLSTYFMHQLPIQPFETFNEKKRSEYKRLKDLLVACLKHPVIRFTSQVRDDVQGLDLYKLYTERWNKIIDHNKEKERLKEEQLKADEVIQVGVKRERDEDQESEAENEAKRQKTD